MKRRVKQLRISSVMCGKEIGSDKTDQCYNYKKYRIHIVPLYYCESLVITVVASNKNTLLVTDFLMVNSLTIEGVIIADECVTTLPTKVQINCQA